MRTILLLTLMMASGTATAQISYSARAARTVDIIQYKFATSVGKRETSFKPTWQRYPSPDVFMNRLQQQFPNCDLRQIDRDCRMLTDENRALLGDSEPHTGSPSIDTPNSATANWYNRCLAQYVKHEAYGLTKFKYTLRADGTTFAEREPRPLEFFNDYFGVAVVSEALQLENKSPTADGRVTLSSFNILWKKLSPETQRAMIRHQMERFVGPEDVVIDLGLASSENQFVDAILGVLNKFIATPDAQTFTFLDVDGGSRVYLSDVTKIVQYLIMFQDVHKE